MKWRWLIYDYIPPELNVSRSRRREIRDQFRKQAAGIWKRGWKTLLLGYILAIVGMSAYFFILNYLWTLVQWPYALNVILFAVVPVGLYLLGVAIWRARYEKITFDVLRQFGYRVCLNCGYRLDYARDDLGRCPECGTLPEPMPPPLDSMARS